jgi:uncharacterized protein (TIGR00369 family)
MPQKYLQHVQEPGQTVNPLFAFLGIVVETLSPEKVVLRLPFRPDFIQGAGMIAGGLMAALADEAMAHVVLANVSPGQNTATIEMNMRYLRAAARGDMRGVATLIKKGRRIITVQAELQDDERRALALAGATFMVVHRKS